MPATEPPHVTDAERNDTQNVLGRVSLEPQAGSWRTLVQEFDGESWITRNVYPGDWALQWEHVAADERRRNERYRQAINQAAKTINDLGAVY